MRKSSNGLSSYTANNSVNWHLLSFQCPSNHPLPHPPLSTHPPSSNNHQIKGLKSVLTTVDFGGRQTRQSCAWLFVLFFSRQKCTVTTPSILPIYRSIFFICKMRETYLYLFFFLLFKSRLDLRYIALFKNSVGQLLSGRWLAAAQQLPTEVVIKENLENMRGPKHFFMMSF